MIKSLIDIWPYKLFCSWVHIAVIMHMHVGVVQACLQGVEAKYEIGSIEFMPLLQNVEAKSEIIF